MNTPEKFFFLNRNCIISRGPVNGIVFNLENGTSFEIDEIGAEVLCNSEKGYNIKKISMLQKVSNKEVYSFLTKIEKLCLGSFSQEKYFSDNFKHFKENNAFIERTHGVIKLKTLVIEISDRCFLNCINCNKKDSYYAFCGCSHSNHKNSITTQTIRSVIKEATNFNLDSILFIGGDPLLHESRLKELLSYSNQLGIRRIRVFTNCTFLNQSLISHFSKFSIEILVPIYSYDELQHDSITRINGSFRKTVNNLLKLIENKIKVLPMIYNFADKDKNLSNTIKFIKNLGFKSYKVDLVYPKLNKPENKYYFNTFINMYNQKLKELPRLDGNLYLSNKYINPCLYCKVAIAINGDIIPCQIAKDYSIGNINSLTLSESLKKGLLDKYWYLSKDKTDRCGDCERRYACMDCTILTHKLHNNYISRNIFCDYLPSEGIWNNKSINFNKEDPILSYNK